MTPDPIFNIWCSPHIFALQHFHDSHECLGACYLVSASSSLFVLMWRVGEPNCGYWCMLLARHGITSWAEIKRLVVFLLCVLSVGARQRGETKTLSQSAKIRKRAIRGSEVKVTRERNSQQGIVKMVKIGNEWVGRNENVKWTWTTFNHKHNSKKQTTQCSAHSHKQKRLGARIYIIKQQINCNHNQSQL